ncbi:MAG: YbjQ family protein [Gammaproteobacteria bacterium WSBS_2016_MAG_OTU1]
MILTTTHSVEGKRISEYLDIVIGGDLLCSDVDNRNIEAVRAATLKDLKKKAEALGADAVVGICIDHEVATGMHHEFVVSCYGTAVLLK